MYFPRNFELPSLVSQPSLGSLTVITDTKNFLGQEMPIWQALLIGFGAIAGVVWIAGGIQREAKHFRTHAEKSLGL